MIYVGVDPGVKGWIVCIDNDAAIVGMHKIPMIEKEYDPVGVVSLIRGIEQMSGTSISAFIEKVMPLPIGGAGMDKNNPENKRFASAKERYKQGYCVGMFHAAFGGEGIPVQDIHPMTWRSKVLVGYGKGKGASVQYINKRYPELEIGKRPKYVQDNLADAICLALYGRMYVYGLEKATSQGGKK